MLTDLPDIFCSVELADHELDKDAAARPAERERTLDVLAIEGKGHRLLGSLETQNRPRATSIRFDILVRICEALECQPGDLLSMIEGDEGPLRSAKGRKSA